MIVLTALYPLVLRLAGFYLPEERARIGAFGAVAPSAGALLPVAFNPPVDSGELAAVVGALEAPL